MQKKKLAIKFMLILRSGFDTSIILDRMAT